MSSINPIPESSWHDSNRNTGQNTSCERFAFASKKAQYQNIYIQQNVM